MSFIARSFKKVRINKKRELLLMHLQTRSQLGPQVCGSIAIGRANKYYSSLFYEKVKNNSPAGFNLQSAPVDRGSVSTFAGRLARWDVSDQLSSPRRS